MFYMHDVEVSRVAFMNAVRTDLRGTGRANIRVAFKWMREYGVYKAPKPEKSHTHMAWHGVSLAQCRDSMAYSVKASKPVAQSVAAQRMRKRLVNR